MADNDECPPQPIYAVFIYKRVSTLYIIKSSCAEGWVDFRYQI